MPRQAHLALRLARDAQPTHIPQLQRLVQAAADELFSVGRERDAIDAIFMSSEFLYHMARCHFPDSDRRVQAASGDEMSVGRKGNRGNPRIIVGQVGISHGQNLGTVRRQKHHLFAHTLSRRWLVISQILAVPSPDPDTTRRPLNEMSSE